MLLFLLPELMLKSICWKSPGLSTRSTTNGRCLCFTGFCLPDVLIVQHRWLQSLPGLAGGWGFSCFWLRASQIKPVFTLCAMLAWRGKQKLWQLCLDALHQQASMQGALLMGCEAPPVACSAFQCCVDLKGRSSPCITESQNDWGWKGLLGAVWSDPCLSRDSSSVAQVRAQMDFNISMIGDSTPKKGVLITSNA